MKRDTLRKVQKKIRTKANKHKARALKRFFKTGPGEYGYGDIFLGIVVPTIRKIVKESGSLSLSDTRVLLRSKFHEERLLALLLLVDRFRRASVRERKAIFDTYIEQARFINNWDLVDISAPHIVGAYLSDKKRSVLCRLARSQDLWERRIAVVATYYFIRHNQFNATLDIVRLLLNDSQDLIHKASGWMLREVGKRDMIVLKNFLKLHYKKMPRTMLRYAIEKFPHAHRLAYLHSDV